ncbi:hypothetical protein DKM44_08510 [Deinococcus irradiatisoli]|uniref:Uncharacterized protein n=2 Tax=Deinococcus irradiatisoli TaxID=2202254 RepID=A0A2Z3JDZ1_9DEIO|nr:hypothetical protein DKM44_08510 [Deinococcus irradiatisoli]
MALWSRIFAGWRFQAVRDETGQLTEAVERATKLVWHGDADEVRRGALIYAVWPQANQRLPALVNLTDDRQFVTVRVFASHLTEGQRLTEQLVVRMLRERAFTFVPGVRVALAITVGEVRTDLTSGQVSVQRGSVLSGFYRQNKYLLNVTLAVLLITLSVVLLITPEGNYTPLGKFYGLSERVLSAVLLNFLLLISQFLFFARHHNVIAWDAP